MQLRFLNMNIWDGGRRMENISQLIKDFDPHIISLQEALETKEQNVESRFHTIKTLQKHFDYPYTHYAPQGNLTRWDVFQDAGNAILSTFPIQKTNVTFYDLPYVDDYKPVKGDWSDYPRNLQHATLDVNGTELHIFNTQGIWGFDPYDTDRRIQMCQTIADQVKENKPFILSGDFNMTNNTKGIDIVEQYARDIFKGELESTFNVPNSHLRDKEGFKPGVIDFIFVSDDITVINKQAYQGDYSDHVPLGMTFELKEV